MHDLGKLLVVVGVVLAGVGALPSSDGGKEGTKRTRVTLLTDHGLQQFVLEEAESLQFTDPGLRGKVAQALRAIQAHTAKDARTLELSARGEGTGPSAEAGDAMSLRAPVPALTSRTVGAYFAGLLAKTLDYRLRVTAEPGGFRILCETGEV